MRRALVQAGVMAERVVDDAMRPYSRAHNRGNVLSAYRWLANPTTCGSTASAV